ncbi:hypothetical protein [Variovorax sp.]|jgi:hypothetical protein|uniref:hypothetical protein n=1 Tax=Variovorax sp. TaxID=1871043 RepID=UPI0012107B66|nr:hypothetical protein [Variovorax sp.]TAJ63870.1 MAG: hypothetical protein EPO53_14025 [Variovorax sp.]
MNDLLILEIEQGRWVARVANTDIEYAFRYLVEEPQLSSLCVQSLAVAMQSGRQQVINSIAGNGIFDLPAGTPPETVVAELFDATAALRYEGAAIFVAETVLADELEQAGIKLLAVVP